MRTLALPEQLALLQAQGAQVCWLDTVQLACLLACLLA